MRKAFVYLCVAVGFCFLAGILNAENEDKTPSVELDKIVVREKPDKELVEINTKILTTQETLPKESINILLNEAQTGSYKAMEMLPSANVQTADPYGLALGKALRLRGAFSADEFIRNIEGLPVSSHGGGGDFIDFENIQSINIYRGAMPPERSFGVRNLTGGMDLSILWPTDRFGITFKQSVGSFNFTRTFGRVDSGILPTGTSFFASLSQTSADKWRGEGGQPSNRSNFEMGISQKIGDKAKLEIFGVYQDNKQNDYRALTYAQIKDLSTYYKYDYNKVLTGIPAMDSNYYDYTRQSYRDWMILANLEIKPTEKTKLTLKPYY